MNLKVPEKNKIIILWYLSLGMFYFSLMWIFRNLIRFATRDFIFSLILAVLTSGFLIFIAKLRSDKVLKISAIGKGIIIFALISIIVGCGLIMTRLFI